MSDQTRKAEQFRGLHVPGRPLILFNIWDAGGAKAVASGGAYGRALNREVLRYVAELLELAGHLLRAGSTLTLKAEPTQFRRISEYDRQPKANE